MKIGTMLGGLSVTLIASQALAENWIAVAKDDKGASTFVDKDSIRRGSDGLVYYTYSNDDDFIGGTRAADCPRRVTFLLKVATVDYPDWRKHGDAIVPHSIGESMFQYACANAG